MNVYMGTDGRRQTDRHTKGTQAPFQPELLKIHICKGDTRSARAEASEAGVEGGGGPRSISQGPLSLPTYQSLPALSHSLSTLMLYLARVILENKIIWPGKREELLHK